MFWTCLSVKINKGCVLPKQFLRELVQNPANFKFHARLGGALFGYFLARQKVTIKQVNVNFILQQHYFAY
ncbi:hypothetical protein FACS189437_03120 [Bacteroidia bacterium]|nr:hypothetical protein FACS189437_03120 [Bacteroidia bacterium]